MDADNSDVDDDGNNADDDRVMLDISNDTVTDELIAGLDGD